MHASDLSRSARLVQDALNAHGIECRVKELLDSTRSAKEAASAIGCGVHEIAKSIIFRGVESGAPVLVIASGTNRVSEQVVSALAGEPITVATPEFVRECTGYAIGGVPPVAHKTRIRTYVDRDLMALSTVWAAAGTPFAVFAIAPKDLVTLSGGQVAQVTA